MRCVSPDGLVCLLCVVNTRVLLVARNVHLQSQYIYIITCYCKGPDAPCVLTHVYVGYTRGELCKGIQ